MLIACTNQKGGVGKSTIAVHLAIWLRDRGYRTALLDADIQCSSSRWMMEADSEVTVASASTPESCLAEARQLTTTHDIVVADGPGGLNDISRTLLLLADLAVIPVTPSILDVRSAREATALLHYARAINRGRPDARIVLNRFRIRETISSELQSALRRFEIPSCDQVIRDLQVFRDVAQQGTVVSRSASKHHGVARELDRLFDELLGAAKVACRTTIVQTSQDEGLKDEQTTSNNR
ncbi:MAG: AAA family ATPase [Pirellulaceae bacterium]|jgi:chromosome partitioning protein